MVATICWDLLLATFQDSAVATKRKRVFSEQLCSLGCTNQITHLTDGTHIRLERTFLQLSWARWSLRLGSVTSVPALAAVMLTDGSWLLGLPLSPLVNTQCSQKGEMEALASTSSRPCVAELRTHAASYSLACDQRRCGLSTRAIRSCALAALFMSLETFCCDGRFRTEAFRRSSCSF